MARISSAGVLTLAVLAPDFQRQELKRTDVTDRIRAATEKRYQELIDAEASGVIGAAASIRRCSRS